MKKSLFKKVFTGTNLFIFVVVVALIFTYFKEGVLGIGLLLLFFVAIALINPKFMREVVRGFR